MPLTVPSVVLGPAADTQNAIVPAGSATVGIDMGSSKLQFTDLHLIRDAANVLAQRNGVNDQGFRVYNTFTDASNFERLITEWISNVIYIVTQKGGTGVARNMYLGSIDAADTYILRNNITRWGVVGSNGNFVAGLDNAYDIGQTGDVRPRAIYVAGSTGIRHQAGTSTLEATMVGVANVNTTAVGNVGVGEDDLITYSLPANALSANGKGIRIRAWGTAANNANAKTVKLYFGTQVILTTALTVSQTDTWKIDATVWRTGASTQDWESSLIEAGTVSLTDIENGTATQTDTAAITIKCTGTATSDNDIVNEGLTVEFLN